ncbi:hypothetical protein [Flavobacterium sp. '19STA2R22 D10 B1']|uniref:hypothetical protein n=1 Tax=Flavobacterium aerium TaxID=3037261 RepID=UPI00278BEA79|nr:hypothetical protein [Flavobacterium sp. '19STA2R22 D10 B1']
MKNLKAWLVILPLITIACSDENTEQTIESASKLNIAKKSVIGPENAANPYDSAGILHNEILEILDETASNSQTIEEITILIDSLSAVHPDLMLLSNNPTVSSRVLEITSIVNTSNPATDLMDTLSLSTSARASFLAFLNSLLLTADSPYEDIHPIIVSYETSVIGSTSFSAVEKQIILTASSVARYSVAKKKRKDQDWDISVTNIVAAASGAGQNSVLGLKMAATVDIYQNTHPTN